MAYRATKTEIEAELLRQGITDAKCKQLTNVITKEQRCIAYESESKCMYWMFQKTDSEGVFELVDQGMMI